MRRKRARRYIRMELEFVARQAYRAGVIHGKALEEARAAGTPAPARGDAIARAIAAGLAAHANVCERAAA